MRKRGLSIGATYDDILLGQYPVDAHSLTVLDPSIQSLLVSADGAILYTSQYNIGYRAAAVLWGDKASEDEYIGGVGGVKITAVDGRTTTTAPDGRFYLAYELPPCPGFTYTVDTPAVATYYYTSFDPRGEPVKNFKATRRETDSCIVLKEIETHSLGGGIGGALLNLTLNSFLSTTVFSYDKTTFVVELMMLNGQAIVTNGGRQVPISGATSYEAKSSNLQTTSQAFYDFDGDNLQDHAVLGDFDAEGKFQPNPDGAHQLIFLSSENEGALTKPAFTRLADSTQDLQHQGLLQTLSEADMKDTDIFVFRESNGMLVMKQNGKAGIAGGEFGINGNDAFYQIMFRGPSDDTFDYFFYKDRYSNWASKTNLNPKLHNRYSDFLRVGERIKIIAINRKTGYIGSSTTTLRNATQPLEELGKQAPDLTTYIDPIVMGPPNLKIWAERVKKDQHGLTAGQVDQYTVGNEGSALDTDEMVAIYTEWYDSKGQPLPAELAGNGYTGRLAKIVGANTLGADTGSTSQFAIDPGKRLQLVKLHEEDITKQHFYVQVSAQPNSGNPDFSGTGAGSGPLQYRPKYYVPFKVPVYDETISLADKLYYNAEKDQLELTDPAAAEELIKPEPYYHWLYRPDYQFSVFDLDIQAINVAQADGNVIDLNGSESPTLSSSDQYLQLIYSLLGNENDVLEGFGPDRELIFAFGEEEAHAYLGEDKTITFLNPEHLADLEPEDFLSVRLYQNSDAENVLWEWAFESEGLKVHYRLPFDVTAVVSEEITNVKTYRTLGGVRLRYRYQLPDEAIPVSFKWTFNGEGRFCEGWYVDSSTCEEKKERQGIQYSEVYWEPKEWTTKVNVPVSLQVTYLEDGKTVTKVEQFRVVTRTIKPGNDALMKGSDVAMLEQMLWQLGISPQKGSMGKGGARINSDRGVWKGKELGFTENCSNKLADNRSVYYKGWSNCKNGQVSMELMVRRFQGRNVSNRSGAYTNSGGGQDGIVGNNTLRQLKRAWLQYIAAYKNNASDGTILNSEVKDVWIKEAVEIWEKGYGSQAEKTYTLEEHNKMLVAAGLAENSKSREQLLRKWKTQETSSHWGEGSPVTPYRMTEGNADEYGSMSFNQVLFKFRYSDKPCSGHLDAGLNFYDPVDNIKGFALHTALKPTSSGSCPGSFDSAYVQNKFSKNHLNIKPIKYRHRDGDWLTIGSEDDAYEILAKAVAGYNGGNSFWEQDTWAGLLRQTRKPKKSDTFRNKLNAQCFSCNYSISVRNEKYGLPYRQYMWEGKKDKDANGDGVIGDNPATPDVVEGEGEQGWCFVYGEKEWFEGKLFSDIKSTAIGSLDSPAIGRVNCSTGAAI